MPKWLLASTARSELPQSLSKMPCASDTGGDTRAIHLRDSPSMVLSDILLASHPLSIRRAEDERENETKQKTHKTKNKITSSRR